MNPGLTIQHILDHRVALSAEMHGRQGILRDYVRGVAHRYATGMYLFGRPGTAKTYTVRRVLDEEIRDIYTYQRGHLTPMGLFELIGEHPDEVIVLDDLGALLRSDVALQILLAALEAPTSPDRGRVVNTAGKGASSGSSSVVASSACPTRICTTTSCSGRSRAASTPSTTTPATPNSAP